MLWLPSFNSLWWRWGWCPYIDTHINKNAHTHTHTPSIQLICHGVSCFYCPFSSHSCDQCNLSDGPSNPYKPINQTTLRNETQKIQEGAKQRSSSDPPSPRLYFYAPENSGRWQTPRDHRFGFQKEQRHQYWSDSPASTSHHQDSHPQLWRVCSQQGGHRGERFKQW